jgi:hypothetical protein
MEAHKNKAKWAQQVQHKKNFNTDVGYVDQNM